MQTNKKLNLDKDLLFDLYINKQMTSKEVGDYFGCTSKTVRNYLSKYGIPIRQNGDAVRLERSRWSDEKNLQRSINFMKTWSKKSPEEREQIAKKKTQNINTPKSLEKAKQTRYTHKTYKKSKEEDNFYKKLLLKFNRDDIIRNYPMDSRYPFQVDFYIKSMDLFIEYQGHQTHGFAPFDSNNAEHINYLSKMESVGVDMSTWIIRDVNKLQTAKRNNINLLLVYPRNENYFLHNRKLIKVDINDII